MRLTSKARIIALATVGAFCMGTQTATAGGPVETVQRQLPRIMQEMGPQFRKQCGSTRQLDPCFVARAFTELCKRESKAIVAKDGSTVTARDSGMWASGCVAGAAYMTALEKLAQDDQ